MTSHTLVNILLVDDEPKNLLALEAVLGPLGGNLSRASSGQEALQHVLETDFAAIILNLHSPTLGNLETAKLIRKSHGTPILFLTDGSDLDLEQAFALGAVDYLTKPVVPAILKGKVEFFVDLHRSKEELRLAVKRETEATFRQVKKRFSLSTIMQSNCIWLKRF